jgi:hypothetical protein
VNLEANWRGEQETLYPTRNWSDDQFRMGHPPSTLRLVDEHFGSAE